MLTYIYTIYTIKHSPNFILSVFQSVNQWFQSNLFSFYFQCLKANIRTKACSHAARVVSPKFLVDSGVQLTLTPRFLRHLYCNLKSSFVQESVHIAAMITKLLLQRVRLCSWGSHRTSVAFLLVLLRTVLHAALIPKSTVAMLAIDMVLMLLSSPVGPLRHPTPHQQHGRYISLDVWIHRFPLGDIIFLLVSWIRK